MPVPSHTVWLLGAGFSKSLGGPLLDDFFTESLHQHIAEPLEAVGFTYQELLGLLAHYGDYAPGARSRRIPAGKAWSDAEQFLAALDSARVDEESPWRRHFGDAPGGMTLARMAHIAHAYTAIATDYFVRDVRHAKVDERWQPYIRWARRVVKAHDTVATFNYDRVAEMAAEAADERMTPVLPTQEIIAERAQLLNLHGSLTWQASGPPKQPTIALLGNHSPNLALREGKRLVIGLPGPEKVSLMGGLLGPLWDATTKALESATRIVIIGYRMPPGDVKARHELLGAISRNRSKGLDIHVVLGADTADKDVKRLTGMLDGVVPRSAES